MKHENAGNSGNIWETSFSDEDRQTQMHDDSVAWGQVAGLLLIVVLTGLVLAGAAVWISGRL
jgi:hypothetical protein